MTRLLPALHLRPASRAPRGFTLIEMMSGLAISSIIVLAVLAAFVGIQGAVQADSNTKIAVESTRLSTSYLERVVRMAGYGIDPRFAFDFTGDKDNVVGADPAFQTDDLAFRYRDPAFLRRGSLGTGDLNLTFEGVGALGKLGVKMKKDQPLLISCSGAQSWWVGKLTADKDESTTTVSLQAYGAPFDSTPPTCMRDVSTDSAAYVFMLHELRIRIANFAGHSYLVAYHGLGDTAANTVFDPIAANVDFFKVEYVMNRPQSNSTCCAALAPIDDAAGNWILGDSDSDAVTVPAPSASPPLYDTAYDDPLRYNAHPANIRQVQLTIGVRGDSTKKTGTFGSVGSSSDEVTVEGEEVSGLPKEFYRTSVRTSIRVPNLSSRSFFVPTLKDPASTESLNVWGG